MNNRILTLQRSLRERGRIRIGMSETRNGRKVPRKLDRFLFSAPDEPTIRHVAELYGGTVEPWAEGGRDRYRVVTDVDDVPVILPTQMAFSQIYEQWAKGFCTRRCDGETCTVPGSKRMEDQDCECDPDNRACKVTTRLSVLLPELGGLGVWRLESHGYYAAVELGAAVELIEGAMAAGARVPARLFLERREVRRLIDGKPEVRKFVVPCLDLNMSVAALGAGTPSPALAPTPPRALRAPAEPPRVPAEPSGWRPVDQAALPPAPAVPVADQLAEVGREPRRRANSAPPMRSTGTAPRPAAKADAGRCDICGEPYGTSGLKKNPEPGSRFVHASCLADGDLQAALAGAEPGTTVTLPPGTYPIDKDTNYPDGVTISGATAPPVDELTGDPETIRRPDKPMTHAQAKKMFATLPEVLPGAPGMSGSEVDDLRKSVVFKICAQLGQPDLVSRSEISYQTASVLLDALDAWKAGSLEWTGEHLVNAETSEPIG